MKASDMLNGKAKEEFEKWLKLNHGYDFTMTTYLKEVMLNALIIEWFDSVGIIIIPRYNEISKEFMPQIRFNPISDNVDLKPFYPTRTESTTKAIEKAVEIFNQLNK